MYKDHNYSRMTIDLPNNLHKKLKALCALLSKSMRSIMIESLEKEVAFLEKEAGVEIKTK